ncbi:MAG: purine-nucleoside phosphorylase [Xanthomonadaceae bacterium]|nr:purine-nucleoside phosphorylase [Xanthomonadaceae bacterium]MDE2256746.1 purine-nucleoside phosphorylase [Xanthomonadaceae bacterium]
MSTPHIDAEPGAFADTVLLPGDPLRARHIAQTQLTDTIQVTARRNMLGYTGVYRGRRVSVMGGGMGIASTAIYATELVRVYGVRRIIRVGTCGGIGNTALGEVLLAQSASTDASFNRHAFGGHDLAACADFKLLRCAAEVATKTGMGVRVASVFSTDRFYDADPDLVPLLLRHGIVAVEMEAAGLYGLAMREGVQALAIIAVSDHLEHGLHLTGAEREQGLDDMAELALECACA